MTSTATSTTTRGITATSTRATTDRARARRKSPKAEWGARALVFLLASTTFLFAGSYTSSLVIPAVCVAVLAAAYRPWRSPDRSPALHRALQVIVAAVALQLVPLPAGIVDRLSPAARGVWQALSLVPVRGGLPLSVDLAFTFRAVGIGGGAFLIFVIARQVFSGGGVRIAARGIATVGLLLAAESLAQDVTAHGLIYWRWNPGEGPPPFGPFLNRNHYATWMVMAIPLCLGYLAAHASVHKRRDVVGATWRTSLAGAFDARSIWLGASICLMLVGLATCLSRSGMVGLVSALLLGAYLRGRKAGEARYPWVVGAIGLALVAAAVRGSAWQMVERFGTAGTAAVYRMNIWRATAEVIGDFWLTGCGAGALETVMLVYQRTPSLFRINAAHNHYLQVAAEGGLLIGIPAALALVLFIRTAHDALARDESGMYLLRAGAASGLFGVAVQSVWDTGLTTPANAVLATLAAAIVVHRSAPRLRPDA